MPDECSPLPLLPNDPPTSAYVHVPFCRHRCGYCNFTLVAGRDDLIDAYLKAIESEMESLPRTYPLETLYLGGGTPTHLPPAALERLLGSIWRRFSLLPGAEFTVEANPLDLTDDRCQLLRDAGVTRISLGVQSFHDAKLKVLERDHRRHDIDHAVDQSRETAPSVSLDLIYAAPGETLEMWFDDVTEVIARGVQHVSIYGLTIEQGSAFYGRWKRGGLQRPAESLEAAMYEGTIDRLRTAGIEQYEVSNFARHGHRSRHNSAYWRGRSYFAFGPGAASYVGGRRAVNHRSTTTWLQRLAAGESAVAEEERLSPEDRARERLVFGLRMIEGLTRQEFAEDTGYEIEPLLGNGLDELVEQGLLQWCSDRLQLTRRGLLVSDAIWPSFLHG